MYFSSWAVLFTKEDCNNSSQTLATVTTTLYHRQSVGFHITSLSTPPSLPTVLSRNHFKKYYYISGPNKICCFGFCFVWDFGGGFICLFILVTITNDVCIQQKPCLSRFWILTFAGPVVCSVLSSNREAPRPQASEGKQQVLSSSGLWGWVYSIHFQFTKTTYFILFPLSLRHSEFHWVTLKKKSLILKNKYY